MSALKYCCEIFWYSPLARMPSMAVFNSLTSVVRRLFVLSRPYVLSRICSQRACPALGWRSRPEFRRLSSN